MSPVITGNKLMMVDLVDISDIAFMTLESVGLHDIKIFLELRDNEIDVIIKGRLRHDKLVDKDLRNREIRRIFKV